MNKPISNSTTGELPLVRMIGGPYNGVFSPITIVLPLLGGGVPESIKVVGAHVYSLRPDRSAWVYTGVVKEAKR